MNDCRLIPDMVTALLREHGVENMRLDWNVRGRQKGQPLTLTLRWTPENEDNTVKHKSPSTKRHGKERTDKYFDRNHFKFRAEQSTSEPKSDPNVKSEPDVKPEPEVNSPNPAPTFDIKQDRLNIKPLKQEPLDTISDTNTADLLDIIQEQLDTQSLTGEDHELIAKSQMSINDLQDIQHELHNIIEKMKIQHEITKYFVYDEYESQFKLNSSPESTDYEEVDPDGTVPSIILEMEEWTSFYSQRGSIIGFFGLQI